MIVVGIDPGTIRTGFGFVRKDGTRLVRIDSGVIRAIEGAPLETRLLAIHRGLEEVLTRHGPDEAAVEDVFFAKNAMSALKLGHARGVVLLALADRGLPVRAYPPALVKRSVVGAGRAAKGQVQRVVQAILGMPSLPAEDEADALAVAICHANASLCVPRRAW
ncbi:MAG: crossover junction endodeoxyribonuclease RuvC [Deltaproteobacteria bacterium]|nr:crossover junction endodeoxyribonuclease RuvC [Deltaproteobacteria bacterium]